MPIFNKSINYLVIISITRNKVRIRYNAMNKTGDDYLGLMRKYKLNNLNRYNVKRVTYN